MRTFFKSLAGLIVICILIGSILAFIGWSRLPDILVSHLSKTLKVQVEIGDLGLGLQKLTVEKFVIDNPSGFSLPKAFRVTNININAPIFNYLHDNLSIEEITLDNVYIGLEFYSPRSTQGNWTELIKNAQNSQKTNSKVKKSILIKKIKINNIQTELLYQSDNKIHHLPIISQIVLYNVSSQGGNLSDQLMHTVLGQMIKEVFVQENLKNTLDQIFQLPKSPQEVLQPFQSLFE